MQYNWFKEMLKHRYKELERLKQKNPNNSLIQESIAAIEEFFYYDKYVLNDRPNLETKIEDDYLNLSKSCFIWPIIRKISTIEPFDIPNYFVPSINLSNKEMMEMVHDFYKNATDNKTYEMFMFYWNQRRKNLHFINKSPENEYASTYYLPYSKEAFIQIDSKHEFQDIPTIVHEYGHLIQFYLNYDANLFLKNHMYSEIVSIFFELISAEYFAKDDLEEKGIITQAEMLYDQLDMNELLVHELNLLEKIKLEYYENKNDLRRKIKDLLEQYDNNKLTDLFLTYSPASDYPYAIGYLIASNLFMIYKSDPDKAFYLLYKLISINLKLDSDKYYEELTKLGICEIEGFENYSAYIKRKLTKI